MAYNRTPVSSPVSKSPTKAQPEFYLSHNYTFFVSACERKEIRPRNLCDCGHHLAAIAGMSLLMFARKKKIDMRDIFCSFLLHCGKTLGSSNSTLCIFA
jgi:hypothetical protein